MASTTINAWARHPDEFGQLWIGLVTAVEVSFWVIRTAFHGPPARRDRRTLAGSAAWPHSETQLGQWRRRRWRFGETIAGTAPMVTARTLSPGDRKLTIADSRPPVPPR